MRTRSDRLGQLLMTVFLLTAVGWGCSSDSTGPEPDPDPVPTSIQVTPTSVTLDAIGATVSVAAVVLDQDGAPLAGASVTWSSLDEAVAMVTAGGVITAAGIGATSVRATSGSLTADVAVTVSQAPASVIVTPATGELLPGATLALSAAVTDANGNEVSGATVGWTSGDAAVATVDPATGLVTAVAEGTTAITATAGSATGEAAITVLAPAPDLVIEADATLGGIVNAGSVTIQTGVTVTLTDDLTLNAAGPVRVEGTVVGECRAIAVTTTDSLTLDGASFNTRCVVPASPDQAPRLRLFADGVVTVENSAVLGGGRVFVGNGDDEPIVSFDLDGASSNAMRSPARSNHSPRPCVFRNSTIEAGERATVVGIEPYQGRPIDAVISCALEAVVETVIVRGGTGEDGADVEKVREATAVNGESGGGASIIAGGQLVLFGRTEVAGGSGGRGGSAVATAEGPGGDALSTGGLGGFAGLPFVRAPSLSIATGSELVLTPGADGDGGNAAAVGGDGAAGADGGNAYSWAGDGGGYSWGPGALGASLQDISLFGETRALIRAPIDEASIARVRVNPIVAGSGGNAHAVAGRGGDGVEPGQSGGGGGIAVAEGGAGARSPLVETHPSVNQVGVTLGSGGDARWAGGRGGHGTPDICAAGGSGGGGGSAEGAAGPSGLAGPSVGFSYADGAPGERAFDAFGNGGNGANGTPSPGAAGPAGAAAPGVLEGLDPSATDNSFRPGTPGAAVDCATQTTMAFFWTIATDPNQHGPFVLFDRTTEVEIGAQFEQNTMSLTARVGPMFPMAGELAAPGGAPGGPEGAVTPGEYTFAIEGEGTAAGFSGVRAVFTGTLQIDDQGHVTALTGEMTVDADNDTFPPDGMGNRNPIVYDVTGEPASTGPGR